MLENLALFMISVQVSAVFMGKKLTIDHKVEDI